MTTFINESYLVENNNMADGYSNDTPDFLYHYTSLESLSLILESKAFLFRRLSDLNDPLEGKNDSFAHAEKLVYSSSWTANENDTLPMWKMYPGLDGVKIKMRRNLFQQDHIGQHGKWPPTKRILNYTNIDPITVHVCDPRDLSEHPVQISILSGPDHVKYVPRNEAHDIGDVFWLRDPVFDVPEKEPVLHLAHVGLTKSDDWAFEDEWRFRLPYRMHMEIVGGKEEHVTQMLLPKEDHVLVPFNPKALFDVEILTGPKFTAGQTVLLNGLVAQYAPNAKLFESNIQIR